MAQLYHWPVPCTICESPVEYHCNTCGDVLCSKCRDNHLKSNATKRHDVVPYSQRTQPNKPPLQCGDHPGQQCVMWCKTCNRAVCTDCATSYSHVGHHFLKFNEKLKERKKEIQNQFDKYSSLLSDWQNSLTESKKLKVSYEKDVQKIDEEIVARADEICRQVRALEKENRKQLQKIKDASFRVLQGQQKSMTDGIERLKGKIKLLEDILRSNDTSTLLQGPIEEIADTKPSLDLTLPLPDFKPGSTNIKVLQEMLGSLSDKTVQRVEAKPIQSTQAIHLLTKPSVGSTINIHTSGYTPAVACVGSDQAWVQTAGRRLQLVNRQGTVKKSVNIDFSIRDLAVTPQGDTLLPDYDNNCISTMTMEGNIKKLFSTEWTPYGMCCLPSGDVIVAFKDDKRVVQYSSTGKIIRELDTSLLQFPWYVSYSQVNQQLYVCDKAHEYILAAIDRVLALDINGSLQYTYTGSDPKTFTPVDICTDQTGHVLITDFINNKVHILDKGGNFLQYLMTGEQGLTLPHTIDVDSEGFAWIGEWGTGKLKVVKYMGRH